LRSQENILLNGQLTTTMELKQKIKQICQDNGISEEQYSSYGVTSARFDLVPYAPYIPVDWNRILVLAESQQLRGKKKGNSEYKKSLLAANNEELIFRLGNEKITGNKPETQIGITPWDEGFIKLAMLSCFPESNIEQFGVSNAVPWHLDKNNDTLAAFLKYKSIAFWRDILPVLQPKMIICTGKIANSIITGTGYCSIKACLQFHIRSASQLHFMVEKTYRANEWLDKNPVIKELFRKNAQLINPRKPYRYFVWYAAHAVSKIKPILDQNK